MLTAKDVRQQYKGNTLLPFHGLRCIIYLNNC